MISTIPAAELDRMYAMNVISDKAPVQPDRLRLIKVTFIDFQGNTQKGEIIVMDVCAAAVASIFDELYQRKFPIQKVRLITAYEGSDDASMADNNTSAFNFRSVAGSKQLSLHSYGTAIDINPVQNPYVILDSKTGIARYLPPASIQYANRNVARPGKSQQVGFAEEVVDIFAKHGFYGWGGYWDSPLDYQHFQLDRQVSYVLAKMSAGEATWFFNTLKEYHNKKNQPLEAILRSKINVSIDTYYEFNKEDFKSFVEHWASL